ncbi:MAG: hypothetical protein IKF64_01715 [Eubacterium sp.]|nr:hypothetical protein [Eubacterium sp.]
MKKILKGILLSVSALAVGYFAIALPFNLFNTLSDRMMEIIFMSELIIYLIIGAIFLVAGEKKKQERIKAEERHVARREKIAQVQRDWYDLAA